MATMINIYGIVTQHFNTLIKRLDACCVWYGTDPTCREVAMVDVRCVQALVPEAYCVMGELRLALTVLDSNSPCRPKYEHMMAQVKDIVDYGENIRLKHRGAQW